MYIDCNWSVVRALSFRNGHLQRGAIFRYWLRAYQIPTVATTSCLLALHLSLSLFVLFLCVKIIVVCLRRDAD